MGQSVISEKEFQVIKQIADNGLAEDQGVNQRLIARQTGMSLGLTNLIIKRMVSKGYIKLKQLTPKKIQYFLTPKGLAEKAKKSYRFALRTIDTLKQMKNQIQQIILDEYRRGARKFIIKGNGELADIVKIVFQGLQLTDAVYCEETGERFLKNSKNKIRAENVLILLAEANPIVNSKFGGERNEFNEFRQINLLRMLADKLS